MKKPRVKSGTTMALNRETLRQLATRQLGQVVAGTDGTGGSNNACQTDVCYVRIPAG